MRFTLVALGATQMLAMRPEVSRASVSKTIASIGDIMSKISSPKESLASLREVSSQVSVLMQQGPVDDHIGDDDRQLLSSVISLIEKTIYSSMDDSHNADVAELDAAIKAAEACNADIAARQSPEGDLGVLHAAVQAKQQELDRLQGVVDDKTEINNTKWEEFDSHMQMISTPPACPGLPARTMPALDVYFEKSEYSVWFAAQQASYTVVRDAFVAADGALGDAIHAYNIQKAIRDVQYCDWKGELEAACAAFDKCFREKSDFYTKILVPRVTSDMNSRIEVKKAGDTVIHQINFLLGAAAQQETPTIDTSRYQIDFPTLPPKGVCDLSPLDADEWVPSIDCEALKCVFTAHNDGLADGIIVTGAGTARWNGCYDRAAKPKDAGGMTSAFMYQHQEHSGSIYALEGTWRIAEWGNYTAYQAPGIRSSTVPLQGWAAGLDERTPVGLGDGPAPTAHEVFA